MYLLVLLIGVVIVALALKMFIEGYKVQEKEESVFPFRLLCNEKRELIPVVALTAFFRTDGDRQRYEEYLNSGTKVIGFTSYKTFPNPMLDGTGDDVNMNDSFAYTKEIQNWVCCFKSPAEYGFTDFNNLLEMSESDFKDVEDPIPKSSKVYDFMYVCLQDEDNSCPLNGWNAVNRNFNLALKCFPIMIQKLGLKVLVVGRLNCGLEELYGDRIEVVGFLPYHEFQDKMKACRYLFVPNVYDASPRVVTEALSKDIPVLMNRNIVCGSKYINDETGELFTDENDVEMRISSLMKKDLRPREWWAKNYSRESSGVKFRNFLREVFPDEQKLQDAAEVQFF